MRALGKCALWMLLCGLPGCSFLTSSEREYISNSDVLASAAEASDYVPDPALFRLTGLDIREDSLTFQYRGVSHPGDHAWVVRFSQKSSEQQPAALADIYSLLPLLKEGREGFKVVEEGEKDISGARLRFVRYQFQSPIRDGTGKPLAAHGIVSTWKRDISGSPVIYHIKLDNHGDRDDLGLEDLQPFLDPAVKG